MRLEDRDAAHLWDMFEAAQQIREFVDGVGHRQFSEEPMRRFAVERELITIGEAAKKVSRSFQDDHPEIPWGRLVGQRNVLAHEYGEILTDRVWHAATETVPDLVRALDPLIPPLPPKAEWHSHTMSDNH